MANLFLLLHQYFSKASWFSGFASVSNFIAPKSKEAADKFFDAGQKLALSYGYTTAQEGRAFSSNHKFLTDAASSKRLKIVQGELFENQTIMNKSLENKTLNVLAENFTKDKTHVFGRSEHMTSVIFNGKKLSLIHI